MTPPNSLPLPQSQLTARKGNSLPLPLLLGRHRITAQAECLHNSSLKDPFLTTSGGRGGENHTHLSLLHLLDPDLRATQPSTSAVPPGHRLRWRWPFKKPRSSPPPRLARDGFRTIFSDTTWCGGARCHGDVGGRATPSLCC